MWQHCSASRYYHIFHTNKDHSVSTTIGDEDGIRTHRKDCRVKEKLFCTACKRYQHLAKVCVTTLSKQLNTKKKDNSVKSLMTDDDLSEYEYDTNQIMIYQINHQLNSKLSDKIFVNVLLSGET